MKGFRRGRKILFICDHSMSLIGGSQESVKVVMNGIKHLYDVSLFTPGRDEYIDPNVSHYHFSKYGSMKTMLPHPIEFLGYYLNLLRIIRREGFAIVHTQEQIGFFAVSFMKRLQLIDRRIILIHTERGLREKYGRVVKLLFNYSLKYTNVLVTTTHYNHRAWEEMIRNRYSKRNISCKLIENTAGMLYEKYDAEERKDSEKLRIGFAGRYCAWKGWDLAEEICNGLAENPAVEIHIAMGCLTESDTLVTQEMFRRLEGKLGDRFHGKMNLNMEQMDKFYYGIDVFVLTSKPHTESFGRVLVEAMSRKVAVIGTDCGGAVEVIGDPELICYGAESFIQKINMFEKDRALLSKIQEEGYQRVRANYSLKNNIEKHKQIYMELLSDTMDEFG